MSSNILDKIIENLKNTKQEIKIILPEGKNAKIQNVAKKFKGLQVKPILIFDKESEITKNIKENFETFSIDTFDKTEMLSKILEKRKGKLEKVEAENLINQRNYFSIMLLEMGYGHGVVGGIEYATKDIVKPTLQIIKKRSDVSLASSLFLMLKDNEKYIFTDCALNVDPTAEQLADITQLAIEASEVFLFENPNVALLSYSTMGSGIGAPADKVRKTWDILKERKLNNCVIGGDFQFDAAYNDEIREKKAPNSPMKKRADIYVFPSLESANIGYKIAQRLGGFTAAGPIIVGLNKPVNDLSRGATENDIYNTIAITAFSALKSIK
ncbi:phosphotransacetylase [Spiroplasma endosymbiont of Anurida maritima]|uniref:phosphotransacetylase n=1 Tax=Spiroplasma endosymbiont of Anurida maritima TaxID=2967972 RepID=UPI0036D42C4D